jgi:uncharacterized protein (TIGR02246 family)
MSFDATDEAAVRTLYQRVIAGWNERNAQAFAAPFAADGHAIGYDGSEHTGRAGIAADLGQIFANHETPRYVVAVRAVRPLGTDAAVLRAATGLVLPGSNDVAPQLNALQTATAAKLDGQWQIVLLQSTPAQYHGRPELAEALTAELREALHAAG